jgi:hypothetical protein
MFALKTVKLQTTRFATAASSLSDERAAILLAFRWFHHQAAGRSVAVGSRLVRSIVYFR